MKTISILFVVLLFLGGCAANHGIVKLSGDDVLPKEPSGFNITFKNDSDRLMCYRLSWFDHGFDFSGPVSMCGGELKPGKSNEVKQGYPAGMWGIEWYDAWTGELLRNWKTARILHIPNNVHHILTTPKEDILE